MKAIQRVKIMCEVATKNIMYNCSIYENKSCMSKASSVIQTFSYILYTSRTTISLLLITKSIGENLIQ